MFVFELSSFLDINFCGRRRGVIGIGCTCSQQAQYFEHTQAMELQFVQYWKCDVEVFNRIPDLEEVLHKMLLFKPSTSKFGQKLRFSTVNDKRTQTVRERGRDIDGCIGIGRKTNKQANREIIR